ncbi:alpha/beta fold hydrolase [Micromonospora sp. CPCC 205711]|uniref:alpha/beta fold hydrolase n=1 Tax=Micromonospora sp. CPCC 205547 TaxID=3122400 RepID=UPI002FF2DBED
MPRFTTQDYWIDHRSTIPANTDQPVKLFVRWHKPEHPHGERRRPVVMVHGRSIPGLVAFDLGEGQPGYYEDYSWSRELAKDGYDVFVMDLQGIGRSTRPSVMNDKCNINPAQQLIVLPQTCPPTYAYQLSNSQSDWDELDKVVNWAMGQTGTSKVDLVGYSAGAFAVGPYAMAHSDRVSSLLLLAPAFAMKGPSSPVASLPLGSSNPPPGFWGFPMLIQDKPAFETGWNNEVFVEPRCPEQRDDAHHIVDVVWQAVMNNDDVGRSWGPGVLRFRNPYWWGWNPETVGSDQILGDEVPMLIVYGEKDKIAGDNPVQNFCVPKLYDHINGQHKLMFRVDATGHHIVWERQRKHVHKLSKKWLKSANTGMPYSIDSKSNGSYGLDWDGDRYDLPSSTIIQTQDERLLAMSLV